MVYYDAEVAIKIKWSTVVFKGWAWSATIGFSVSKTPGLKRAKAGTAIAIKIQVQDRYKSQLQ